MQRTSLLVAVVLTVVVGAVIVGMSMQRTKAPSPVEPVVTPKAPVPATYTNNELGIEFTYPSGEEGLVLKEHDSLGADEWLVDSLSLMTTADSERMLNRPPDGGEGPAMISLYVLRNDEKLFSLGSAEKYTLYSNYNLKIGEEKEVVVGGANGIEYRTDGLYQADTIVVNHGANTYVLIGAYTSDADPLREHFRDIVSSFSFVPTGKEGGTRPAAKINIDAVCEGVLAYMTFSDGAAADAFVAECKEGKHPEVIERYKQDLNLGDGAAI